MWKHNFIYLAYTFDDLVPPDIAKGNLIRTGLERDKFFSIKQNSCSPQSNSSINTKCQINNGDDEFGASCSSNVNNIEGSTEMLVDMFPHGSVMQARFLLEITKGDCDVTCNAIIEVMIQISIRKY